MGVRFVPPVKSTVQQVLLESPVYDQVLSRGEIRLKGSVNFGQLLPGSFRCGDLLLVDEKPKIGECELSRKPLLQPDQTVPSVFCGRNFLFRNKQAQKR